MRPGVIEPEPWQALYDTPGYSAIQTSSAKLFFELHLTQVYHGWPAMRTSMR